MLHLNTMLKTGRSTIRTSMVLMVACAATGLTAGGLGACESYESGTTRAKTTRTEETPTERTTTTTTKEKKVEDYPN